MWKFRVIIFSDDYSRTGIFKKLKFRMKCLGYNFQPSAHVWWNVSSEQKHYSSQHTSGEMWALNKNTTVLITHLVKCELWTKTLQLSAHIWRNVSSEQKHYSSQHTSGEMWALNKKHYSSQHTSGEMWALNKNTTALSTRLVKCELW